MKTLEKTFIKNANQTGKHTFTQLRRDGNVCLYKREKADGTLFGYEVFVTRIVKANDIQPEDMEQYPGTKTNFGKTAWFIGGKGDEKRANEKFDALIKGLVTVEEPDETEGSDEGTTIPVVKVVSTTSIKAGLTLPDGAFSQKRLAAFNNIENYKHVYSDLQKMLARGILKHGPKVESARGKKTQLFVRA